MKLPLAFVTGMLACAFAAQAADIWTLERSLDYALANNPDARIAQQRIAAAQAGLEQANSAFWPKLQVQSSYTRTDNPMLAFGSILNQRSYSSSLNFNAIPSRANLPRPLSGVGGQVTGARVSDCSRSAPPEKPPYRRRKPGGGQRVPGPVLHGQQSV